MVSVPVRGVRQAQRAMKEMGLAKSGEVWMRVLSALPRLTTTSLASGFNLLFQCNGIAVLGLDLQRLPGVGQRQRAIVARQEETS
jgi:hypothetical protein